MRFFLPLVACCLIFPAAGQTQTPAPKLRAPGISEHDDRLAVDMQALPWRAIGKVQTNLGSACTGVLVGERQVLSAGHCIFNRRTQALLQPVSLHFLVGYARGEYAAHTRIVKVEHAANLAAALRAKRLAITDDWLILTLEQPLGRQFGIVRPAPKPLKPGMGLKTAGYGMDRAHILSGDLDCTVVTAPAPGKPAAIAHNCETTHGNSGGPLLVEQDGEVWLAGIITSGSRIATGQWIGYGFDVSVVTGKLATTR
jgi:protease YdgD